MILDNDSRRSPQNFVVHRGFSYPRRLGVAPEPGKRVVYFAEMVGAVGAPQGLRLPNPSHVLREKSKMPTGMVGIFLCGDGGI